MFILDYIYLSNIFNAGLLLQSIIRVFLQCGISALYIIR